MQELKCLPDASEQVIEELQARIATLTALSRVFSLGGESLDQTLAELIHAYSNWIGVKEGERKSKGENTGKVFVLSQSERSPKNKSGREIMKRYREEGNSSEDRVLLNLIQAYENEDRSKWVFEFNRLFVGPKSPPTPPYESVYRHGERLVLQDSTFKVRRRYRAEGLVLAGSSNEPDDFIATELEFVAYLLTNAFQYFRQNKIPQALAYLENYNTFYQDHLAIWLPRFVQSFSSFAKMQVFVNLGELILRSVIPIDVKSPQSV